MEILALLPLLLTPLLMAALAKLAALLMRRTQLRWPLALKYSVLAMLVGSIATVLIRVGGDWLPPAITALLGVVMQLAIGGWYLGPRATTAAGVPIGFKGGALLTLILCLLFVALGLVLGVVLPLMDLQRP